MRREAAVIFDEARFEGIYSEYAKALMRYCLVRLKTLSSAEEAVNDVFLVLYRKWDTLDLDGNMELWLYRTAEYCILHQKEKYARYTQNTVQLPESFEDFVEDVSPPPDEAVIAGETLRRIEGKLPEKYSALFRLRYIEGLTIAQTARRLERNYTTVRFQCRRMEELLRKIVGKSSLE